MSWMNAFFDISTRRRVDGTQARVLRFGMVLQYHAGGGNGILFTLV